VPIRPSGRNFSLASYPRETPLGSGTCQHRKWSFVQIMILTKVVVEGAVVMTIEDANIAAMREIFGAHIINRLDSGS
jgi:hypothetical protein